MDTVQLGILIVNSELLINRLILKFSSSAFQGEFSWKFYSDKIVNRTFK